MTFDDHTHAPLPQLSPRAVDSHKGDYGRALLIGGSLGMSGAIALSGRATLRSGAGLVTIAVPACVQDVVASLEPSYMTHGLPDQNGRISPAATEAIVSLAQSATVVAIGPGLGRDPILTKLVAHLYREVEKPTVVDADALFALSETIDVIAKPGGVRILTPHPGEFARLTNRSVEENDRIEAAASLAARDISGRTIVLVKGHRTVVTDGSRYSLNNTGNPGMATGGTGDVLTGIITGLLCQGLTPFEAARLGAHLHGAAGDLAAEYVGEVSLIASDLIDYLPQAFQSLNHPS